MASLCHPWFTTTNLSYRFPIFETSATALRGTTAIYILYILYIYIYYYYIILYILYYTILYYTILYYIILYYIILYYIILYYIYIYYIILYYILLYYIILCCYIIYYFIYIYITLQFSMARLALLIMPTCGFALNTFAVQYFWFNAPNATLVLIQNSWEWCFSQNDVLWWFNHRNIVSKPQGFAEDLRRARGPLAASHPSAWDNDFLVGSIGYWPLVASYF